LEENSISIDYLNKTRIPWNKGKKGVQTPWNKGKKMSEDTFRKLSESGTLFKKGRIPWMKGKKHSEESRRKMSEYQKGKLPWNKGTKGLQIAWNKGKTGIFSEETRKKLSEAHRNISQETRRKMSESKKGKSTWMKGKKHSEESRRKMSESLKGKTPSEETRRKLSESRTGGRNPFFGKKHSEETRKKLSEAHRNISQETRKKMSESHKVIANSPKHIEVFRKTMTGRIPWNKGKSGIYSEETKRKLSEARLKQVFPLKDSKSVELQIQKILKDNGIVFTKHYNIKLDHSNHQADILVPPNFIIEGFGDYWHFNPQMYDGESFQKFRHKLIKVKEVWVYDEYVINGMRKQGYKVLVVWEGDLEKNIERATQNILNFLQNRD